MQAQPIDTHTCCSARLLLHAAALYEPDVTGIPCSRGSLSFLLAQLGPVNASSLPYSCVSPKTVVFYPKLQEKQAQL